MTSKNVRKILKPNKKILTDKLPKNEKEYLELLIKTSENAITGRNGGVDELFVNQIAKLKKQLKETK